MESVVVKFDVRSMKTILSRYSLSHVFNNSDTEAVSYEELCNYVENLTKYFNLIEEAIEALVDESFGKNLSFLEIDENFSGKKENNFMDYRKVIVLQEDET